VDVSAETPAPTIRPISEADVPALFAVRVATHENRLTRGQLTAMGITDESVAAGLRGHRRGWLCEVGDRVVGFAMGDWTTGELLVIAVLPGYIGRGIGSRLLRAVEAWLEASGCRRLWLTTDVDPALKAYGFYVRHGWLDDRIDGDTRYMVKTVGTRYAKAFFDVQVELAERVSELSSMSIAQALLEYTNLYIRFGIGRTLDAAHPTWQTYVRGFGPAADRRAYTYDFYRRGAGEDTGPAVVARFGCFAYARAGGGRVRLHFTNAEQRDFSPLSHVRRAERMRELAALFMHMRRTEPAVTHVAGASWLYNIDAYRRLFPPRYLASARVVDDRFHRMPLWGQLLDRHGDVKPEIASRLRERLAAQRGLDGLARCFPYRVLAVEAPARVFYEFHGV
jgi:GNAT superfamily N-acetyltransferase